MSLKKLMENKILNEKMKDVYEKEKNKEYSAAYESVRDILDFINKKFIMKAYNIDLKDTFTVEELEDFLGYYKINNTKGLQLRSYQASFKE